MFIPVDSLGSKTRFVVGYINPKKKFVRSLSPSTSQDFSFYLNLGSPDWTVWNSWTDRTKGTITDSFTVRTSMVSKTTPETGKGLLTVLGAPYKSFILIKVSFEIQNPIIFYWPPAYVFDSRFLMNFRIVKSSQFNYQISKLTHHSSKVHSKVWHDDRNLVTPWWRWRLTPRM